MIVLSNSEDIKLLPGESIPFDMVVLHTGCGESHRPNTASVRLRCNGVYELHFSGNVENGSAGAVLRILLDHDALFETTMISESETTENVATQTFVKNICGDYDHVSVGNVSDVPFTIKAGSSFTVKRLA